MQTNITAISLHNIIVPHSHHPVTPPMVDSGQNISDGKSPESPGNKKSACSEQVHAPFLDQCSLTQLEAQ